MKTAAAVCKPVHVVLFLLRSVVRGERKTIPSRLLFL